MATQEVQRMAFGPLTVTFDASVLRPRPWTAAQGEWAAELVAAGAAPDGPLLELCSGAGQIGLVAAVLSGRPLVQVDSSEHGCRFARMNADAAGAAGGGGGGGRGAPPHHAPGGGGGVAVVGAGPPHIPTA